MKKLLAASLVSSVLVFASGCGGGGGGGGGGSSSTVSDVAVYVNPNVPANTPANLSELAPGDVIQFEFFTTSSTGITSSVSATSYTINAPSTVATITSAGVLTAVGPAPSGSNYSVIAVCSGHTYTFPVNVGTAAAKVTGVVQTTFATGEAGIEIDFYNGATWVGSATTGTNGSFVANVPATATSFNVQLAGSSTFYSQFNYGTLSYTASVSNCNAPLPSVTVGNVTTLPNSIDLLPIDVNNPPPPPTGCS